MFSLPNEIPAECNYVLLPLAVHQRSSASPILIRLYCLCRVPHELWGLLLRCNSIQCDLYFHCKHVLSTLSPSFPGLCRWNMSGKKNMETKEGRWKWNEHRATYRIEISRWECNCNLRTRREPEGRGRQSDDDQNNKMQGKTWLPDQRCRLCAADAVLAVRTAQGVHCERRVQENSYRSCQG